MDWVPWAMQLTRPGWNAFKLYHSENQDNALSFGFDLLEPARKAEALERLRVRTNVGSDEVVRRRLARGRRLRKPPAVAE